MPKAQNVEKVKEIKERLEAAEAAYFADYRGLSVPDIGEVRTALLEADSQFRVLKNTLTRVAVRDLGREELEAFLDGPTAVAFVGGDIVVGAKALVDATKRYPVLELKGGLAEGRVLSAEQVKDLAALNTREEMLAMAAGLLSAHLRRAASVFQALQSRFVMLLKAYEKKLEEAAPPEPEAGSEAEPEAEAETPSEPEPEPAAEAEEAADQVDQPDQADQDQSESEEEEKEGA